MTREQRTATASLTVTTLCVSCGVSTDGDGLCLFCEEVADRTAVVVASNLTALLPLTGDDAGRRLDGYHQDRAAYFRFYRRQNKERTRENARRRYVRNGADYQRAYRAANRNRLRERERRYRERNADTLAAYQREYYQRNREKIRANQAEYRNKRRAA